MAKFQLERFDNGNGWIRVRDIEDTEDVSDTIPRLIHQTGKRYRVVPREEE